MSRVKSFSSRPLTRFSFAYECSRLNRDHSNQHLSPLPTLNLLFALLPPRIRFPPPTTSIPTFGVGVPPVAVALLLKLCDGHQRCLCLSAFLLLQRRNLGDGEQRLLLLRLLSLNLFHRPTGPVVGATVPPIPVTVDSPQPGFARTLATTLLRGHDAG